MSLGKALRLNLVLCCALGVLVWLIRAWDTAREAARHPQCHSNLKQIHLALLNYHSVYGSFPPAHVDDANGKPMHSWRVLILPFLEQSALYNAYNFNEPWNGPSNSKLITMMPTNYACPSRYPNLYSSGSRPSMTNFAAISGPGTIFPDGATVKDVDIKDGDESTLMVAEVANVDIPWTEPRDLDVRTMSLMVNDPKHAGISSTHPRGAVTCFASGRVRYLTEKITPQELSALITIDGGEPIDIDAVLSR
jgi:hypothetical protein